MPSPPAEFDDIPLSDIPRDLLLDLAESFGIRDDVADLLRDAEADRNFGLRGMGFEKMLILSRAQRRIRPDALAAKCGLSRTQFDAVQRTAPKNTSIHMLIKLSQGFGVPWLVLLCANLRTMGLLCAPGAKPLPRTRVRKCNAATSNTSKG